MKAFSIKISFLMAGGIALGLAWLGTAQHAARPDCSVILGRPTDRSVTANILAAQSVEAFIEYGPGPADVQRKTATLQIEEGKPAEVALDSLLPNTRYSYRLRYRRSGASTYTSGPDAAFRTQRPPGAEFTFVVQADSHLDEGTSPEVYKQSLREQLASSADFLIDLGDTFMSDKLDPPTWDEVVKRHLLARSYFDLVGHSLPLFLVLGNHEGESGRWMNGTAENLAVWATKARKLHYPNPEPNQFYTGSTRQEPFIGLRQNYYAWTWGDALFVVLDPFWYTTGRPGRGGDNWHWTLGREQYDWLTTSLGKSRARFKFVFAHHLVGGLDLDGRARGGIEGAPYFEWGGHNQDGSWGFAEKRPGWAMPIHHLLVKHNVTAFFHGHDHLYARQDLDGIVYQEVPQPSHGRSRNPVGQYAYRQGGILGGSGFLRVHVSPKESRAEFVRVEARSREVAHDYAMPLRAKNTSQSLSTVPGSTAPPAPKQDEQSRPQRGARKGR